MRKNKSLKIFLVLILVTSFITSCSNSSSPSESKNYDQVTEENHNNNSGVLENYEQPTEDIELLKESENTRKKIINSKLNLKVEEINSIKENINLIIEEKNGYVENSELYLNNTLTELRMTIKIPVENYDSTIKFFKNLGKIQYFTEAEEDVTIKYLDLNTKLEIKERERDSLEELIKIENENIPIEDLIRLEKELSNIILEAEQYKESIRTMEFLYSYSTIELNLSELTKYEVAINIDFQSFGGKIYKAIKTSINYTAEIIKAIILFIIYLFIPGLIVGGVAFIMYKLFFKTWLKKRKKENKNLENKK